MRKKNLKITILLTLLLTLIMSGCGGFTSSPYKTYDPMDNVSNQQRADAIEMGKYLTTTKFKILGNKPMTIEQASGILGNGWGESRWRAKAQQYGNDILTNSQAIKYGNTGGTAIGFYQWDISNRVELAKYAEARGKHWSDMSIQKSFIKYYIETVEGGLVGKRMVKYGFQKAGQTVDYYTEAAFYGFEGQLRNRTVSDERLVMGREFFKFFKASLTPTTTTTTTITPSAVKSGGTIKATS